MPATIYWSTAAAIIVLTAALTIEFWLVPSGSTGDSIVNGFMLGYMVLASGLSLKPIHVTIIAPRQGPVAYDEPRTRQAHRIYVSLRLLLLLAGLSAFGIAVAGAVESGERSEDLEENGLLVAGTVSGSGSNGLLGGQTVLVTFELDGQVQEETIQLNDSSPSYEEGQTVDVFINRSDSSKLTLRGESNDSRVAVLTLIFGFVFGLVAIFQSGAGFLASRRQSKLFLTENWRRAQFEHGSSGAGRNRRHILRINDGSSTQVVSIAVINPWVLPQNELRDGGYLEIIGDCDRHGVIRLDDSMRLFHVWSPRRNSTRENWDYAIDRAN